MQVPESFIELAHRLADASGTVIRRHYRAPVAVDVKPDQTPVTVADQQAETVIRDLIRAAEPTHGVIGEEHGAESIDVDWVWVIDPIDGTRAFLAGRPLFGTLIALLYRGAPVMGILDQPILRERWVGLTGRRTTLNGLPCQTRGCDAMSAATLIYFRPLICQPLKR
jgi:inositol-phosphate phosphatase / L-galactose 1-phosphate phosphatase / histidinol-phosphatase